MTSGAPTSTAASVAAEPVTFKVLTIEDTICFGGSTDGAPVRARRYPLMLSGVAKTTTLSS